MAGSRERLVAQAVAEEFRAVMARKQIKRLPLSKASGIPNSTLNNLLDGDGAMDGDVRQRRRQNRAGSIRSARDTTGIVSQDELLRAIEDPSGSGK